jgi:hypothetical protein
MGMRKAPLALVSLLALGAVFYWGSRTLGRSQGGKILPDSGAETRTQPPGSIKPETAVSLFPGGGEGPSSIPEAPNWSRDFPGLAKAFAFPPMEKNELRAREILGRLRLPLKKSRFWIAQVSIPSGQKIIPARFMAVFSDLENRRSPEPLRTLSGPDRLSWNLMGIFSVGGREAKKANLSSLAITLPTQGKSYFLYLDCRPYEGSRKLFRYVALSLPGGKGSIHILPQENDSVWRVLPFQWEPVGEEVYREYLEQWNRADY